LIAGHNCTSSARRRTTTPTSAWVASKVVVILQKHTNIINYDTVCKGRKIALKKLYGSWEDSFQMLFNWKAEVMKRSPDSVIEIGIQ
jgi:hypothetical protein